MKNLKVVLASVLMGFASVALADFDADIVTMGTTLAASLAIGLTAAFALKTAVIVGDIGLRWYRKYANRGT